MKKCSRCQTEKDINSFFSDKSKKDGKSYICKLCHREISKRYYYDNKEKVLLATRKWQNKNAGRVAEKRKEWRKVNPDKRKAEFQRWKDKYPEKAKVLFRGYARERRKTIKGNLVNRIAPSMARSLREGKNGRTWENLVEYTVEDLKKHLEKNFLLGMSWENRNLWHIDHKIPISAFNYETTEDIDFKRCWALSNLRPLWAFENISKKDKILKQFQTFL